MKFAQKTALCLMSLCAFIGKSHADAVERPVKTAIFHLFNPINKNHSQQHLDTLCKVVEGRIEKGEDFKTAFNDEVQKFLLSQLTDAFVAIAQQQNNKDYTSENAQADAHFIITELLVRAYAQKYHANLFEQDPMSLPEHIFAFYTTHYFVTAHGHIALRPQNRMDAATAFQYLYYVRVGMAYVSKGLDVLGVPQAQI